MSRGSIDLGFDPTITAASEIGKRLFVRSISSSQDEVGSTPPTPGKETETAIESSDEEYTVQESNNTDRSRHRRRMSVMGAKLVSQIPPRHVTDNRFVVAPTYAFPSFDIHCFKMEKDLCFFHQSPSLPLTMLCRITKLPKNLLGAATWQIFAGNGEPVAVIKQAIRSINPTFYMFLGTDSVKRDCIYTFQKKLRSSKVRVFNGEGTKEAVLLNCFCLIGSDRVCIKLKDGKALGEALGETIVDWRCQTNMIRIGKGFDVLLAAACFCLADVFEAHALDVPPSMVSDVRAARQQASRVDYRAMMGWPSD